MQSLFFWKDWPKNYRTTWLVLSGILLFSITYMWFTWFHGAHGIIEWQKIQEPKMVETTVHQFRLGPFQLNVPGESYVIFEYLQGSAIEHNRLSSYLFLATLIICSMTLLTVISTLQRLWYYVGMGLFVLFVIGLRLDVVRLFNVAGYTIPVIVITLFIVLSFYFKSIRPSSGFQTRLLSFLILSAICAILISNFSEIPFPLLHLSVTAYLPALILMALFIIMVDHEILVSFVYIASQGTSKSLQHFSIISFIYLINVLITCLHELGVVQWEFLYINLYLLLTISALPRTIGDSLPKIVTTESVRMGRYSTAASARKFPSAELLVKAFCRASFMKYVAESSE